MKIEIEIPKEFEKHFNEDKFKDSLERIMADIKHSLQNGDCLCAGRYEYETVEMLEKAFENSRQAYDIDKVVEELEEQKHMIALDGDDADLYKEAINDAIEIVKQGGVSDEVCECRKYRIIDDVQMYDSSYYHEFEERCVKKYKYCPYCGEKYKGGEVDE